MSLCTDKLLAQLIAISGDDSALLEAILEAIDKLGSSLNDQAVALPQACFKTDADEPEALLPVIIIEDANVTKTLYFRADTSQYEGVAIATDPCDCPCMTCGDPDAPVVKACGLLDFADTFTYNEFKVEADAMGESAWKVEFAVEANGGVSNGSAQLDFLDPVPVNKSEWYALLAGVINGFPNWSMTLVTDVLAVDSGKPVYKIEYTGTVVDTLRWKYSKPDGTTDYYEMAVAADGTTVYVSNDDSGAPFGTPAWNNC